jgi:hypothetical protein
MDDPTTTNREIAPGLRAEGLSYAEIGRRLGISRQRVLQITEPPPAISKLVKTRSGFMCENCGIPLKKGGHIHHKNETGKDRNDVENLMHMCPGCHRLEHVFRKRGYTEPRPNTTSEFLDDNGEWKAKYPGWPKGKTM